MIYDLHPEAEAELTSAALYYSKEASRSIALAFLAEFEIVAELVEANQQLGTKGSQGSFSHSPPHRAFTLTSPDNRHVSQQPARVDLRQWHRPIDIRPCVAMNRRL